MAAKMNGIGAEVPVCNFRAWQLRIRRRRDGKSKDNEKDLD
jgi:hypothetical protein